ncbi:unnamed protein product [Vitrella brassicaformis CCMP3155]|uniref:Uncharacterized protein n=1 Tax=Vitrella brassicaformis (strain CCMP3155) TaxID=1169540 RepID=A0A0G4G874_VITBC|nr:unnamed protein product [Vitrella brassicaformis CCMP3155]|eukprot:CEM24544.1 unnamed protein product [Vitrella brassicaformis CCMP3155]
MTEVKILLSCPSLRTVTPRSRSAAIMAETLQGVGKRLSLLHRPVSGVRSPQAACSDALAAPVVDVSLLLPTRLPADVFARVVIPFLPVDDAVRLRAVGKAYGTRLINEEFLLRRISSSLAQQQLTGLIVVERDRGVDPWFRPLPPSLSRFGYLARCAYVIEQAAEWRMMAAFIKVAGVCGVGRPLPLVLSAERVAAHLPDKASFHRLPAAVAVYKIFGLLGIGQLELREGGRCETDVCFVPSRLLVGDMSAAIFALYLLAYGWIVLSIPLFLLPDTRNGPHGVWFIVRCLAAWGAAAVFVTLFYPVAELCGWLLAFWLHKRRRVVQWYDLGERRFRIIERDELWQLVPFVRPNRHTDRPISTPNDYCVYRSFSGFTLDSLLQMHDVRSRMRVALDVTVRRRCPCWEPEPDGTLPTEFSTREPDLSVITWCEAMTTEAEVAGWVTIDERFPITVARVRQLLRRLGLENDVIGPPP